MDIGSILRGIFFISNMAPASREAKKCHHLKLVKFFFFKNTSIWVSFESPWCRASGNDFLKPQTGSGAHGRFVADVYFLFAFLQPAQTRCKSFIFGTHLRAILDYKLELNSCHHLGRKWAWHIIFMLFPHLDLKIFPLRTFRKDLSSSNRVY